MSRKTIQVSPGVKERVQQLREHDLLVKLGCVSSESDILEFLLDFFEQNDSDEFVQALHLIRTVKLNYCREEGSVTQ